MLFSAKSQDTTIGGIWLSVAAVVVVQVAFAFMNVLVKQALSEGMSRFLLITYRQVVAAVFIIPIAYFVERGKRPKLTTHIFLLLFLSALLGMTGTQYFFFFGLERTSATFGCAFINLTPVITFLFAIPFGMESVNVRSKSGMAKVSGGSRNFDEVAGTVVCLSGSMLMTLYKGRPLRIAHIHSAPTNDVLRHHPLSSSRGQKQWILGCLSLFSGNMAWSSWFIIQARIAKAYPALYSNNAIVGLLSALQSAALALLVNRDRHRPTSLNWALQGKLQAVTVIYGGVVGSGLAYILMAWCVKKRGPAFTAAFSPLVQVVIAIIEVIFLHEQLHIGSVIGSVMIVIGLYVLLCGKSKENEVQSSVQATDGKTTATEGV